MKFPPLNWYAPTLKIWSVSHEHFVTDHIEHTSDLVLAESKEEALKKYNTLAKKRNKYPYFWNQVSLNEVHQFKGQVIT